MYTMAFSSFNTFHSIQRLIKHKNEIRTFQELLVRKKPWGQYSADSWAGNTLTEIGGNTARNATTSGVTKGTASGNGATATISYLSGTTSNTINWTVGSIPKNCTICSITRFTDTKGIRIIQGKGTNFVHGHDQNTRGSMYYGTQGLVSNVSIGTITDWLNAVGTINTIPTPNNVLFNGVPYGTATGGNFSTTANLTINNGQYSGSNFHFSQLLIFDQALTASEMVLVANALNNYLSTGILK